MEDLNTYARIAAGFITAYMFFVTIKTKKTHGSLNGPVGITLKVVVPVLVSLFILVGLALLFSGDITRIYIMLALNCFWLLAVLVWLSYHLINYRKAEKE